MLTATFSEVLFRKLEAAKEDMDNAHGESHCVSQVLVHIYALFK